MGDSSASLHLPAPRPSPWRLLGRRRRCPILQSRGRQGEASATGCAGERTQRCQKHRSQDAPWMPCRSNPNSSPSSCHPGTHRAGNGAQHSGGKVRGSGKPAAVTDKSCKKKKRLGTTTAASPGRDLPRNRGSRLNASARTWTRSSKARRSFQSTSGNEDPPLPRCTYQESFHFHVCGDPQDRD